MSWRVYQRIFDVTAVLMMMAGIVLMWMRQDPHHYFVYGGFVFLATGKLIETLNLHDPSFKILKMSACVCIYLLVILNVFYQVRTLIYIMVPLAVYYLLHYRLMFQQRKA